jgi:hypothetical protein
MRDNMGLSNMAENHPLSCNDDNKVLGMMYCTAHIPTEFIFTHGDSAHGACIHSMHTCPLSAAEASGKPIMEYIGPRMKM